MPSKPHRVLPAIAAVLALSSTLFAVPANAADAQSVMDKLNEFGPEAKALVQRAGIWDVTITNWEKPGATPTVQTGLVAERRMIGPMLEEVLRTVPGAPGAAFTRADFLTFNKQEGRWQYMSMDGRVPDGMMVAYSIDPDPEQRIFMSFLPFASPNIIGDIAIGQFWRMEQVITRQDADHEVKDQYFTLAGSAPVKWRGISYSYTRRK
ncbi:hypothetical protein LJR066_003024 [Acidovorax sp. LjRoot66]|uniref:hypothetical protein n=1 Tax=Acidovorax sp. LjRoot66 TaxID=3342334 RepID=UPI003ECD4A6B